VKYYALTLHFWRYDCSVGTKHVNFQIEEHKIHLINSIENSHIHRINVFTDFEFLTINLKGSDIVHVFFEWPSYYIFYTETSKNCIWLLDGPEITTISATHGDHLKNYYRQSENITAKITATFIPSFLRNPNSLGFVKSLVNIYKSFEKLQSYRNNTLNFNTNANLEKK
jgi:hypothetical protein